MKNIIEKNAISRESNFLWYATRISFYTMIFLWGFVTYTKDYVSFISLLYIVSIFFSFVTSIIHLTKFKEKGLAITSLVISSYGVLAFTIGFIISLIVGSVGV